MIHVDASFLIDLMRERRRRTHGRALAWLEQHAGDELGISLFAVCELEAGTADAADPDGERRRIDDALQVISTIYPDQRCARAYGNLVARLQRTGRSIGTMDTLIAATAILHDVPLLTANERHFSSVPGLRVLSYR